MTTISHQKRLQNDISIPKLVLRESNIRVGHTDLRRTNITNPTTIKSKPTRMRVYDTDKSKEHKR